MRFSKKIDYGFIFLSCLARGYAAGAFVAIQDVSREYGVPYSFMEKIASQLKAAGIIVARKGKKGGYALARPPKKVSMDETVAALERPRLMKCLEAGTAPCFMAGTCPTRRRWEVLDKKILKVFRETTLAEI